MTDALLEAALGGTARAASSRATATTQAERLVESLEDVNDERRLLLMAGARAIYRLAARETSHVSVDALPAPPDDRPVCSPATSGVIADLLGARQPELLIEACDLLARANRRLSPALLPAVLDLGTRSPTLRAALARVVGERGRWLAAFKREWRWPELMLALLPGGGDIDPSAWHEGKPADRIAILQHVRASEPARARSWLAETWRAEKADFRLKALEALANGLSLDDEAFLEAALDDRAETVRLAAAGLLSRLTGSSLARRLLERADEMLVDAPANGSSRLAFIKATLLRSRAPRLDVIVPQALDPAWKRDGIEESAPVQLEPRAWWLIQVLARVPPAHWVERFGSTPPELIAMAARSDLGMAVVEGWSRAAVSVPDTSWASALWDWWFALETKDARYAKVRFDVLGDLFACLPTDEGGEKAARILTSIGASVDVRWAQVLTRLPAPWSARFGERYLASTRERVRGLRAGEFDPWVATLTVAATALPPVCYPSVLAEWSIADADDWRLNECRREVQRFVETIEIRQRLWQSIEEGKP